MFNLTVSSVHVCKKKMNWFLKLMFYVNVSSLLQQWSKLFPSLKNVMGHILASITISGAWVASGATMVELRSIIPCDSHLPPHCTDSLSDQWARHCWIAYRREGLSEWDVRNTEIWGLRERERNCWISALFWVFSGPRIMVLLKLN